eukprot:TRINITY_DN4896_c5_g2_i1.p1 TRINITY_DN4896_c5_g2~~TRINITY_DN4896_c5_g2_i1.p1  ORF type:complete len:403 (-),score=94.76 TRINITY_DN4896_c5_g2_i1:230-1438(-)
MAGNKGRTGLPSIQKARNKARRDCCKAKARLEATVAAQAKQNPKSFWSFVKEKTNTRTEVADLRNENGETAQSDRDKAQVLNRFFQSVFTKEQEGDLPEPPVYHYDSELTSFIITIEAVKKHLKGLKTGTAPGPDGIPPLLLTETAEELAQPVTIIFKKSLEEGRIPEDWRKATVTPIFKKGSRLLPSNYRPVSLTSVLCKVMEALIRDQLLEHLLRNDLICREQHGFTPGRSCTTELLDTLECWTAILDQGGTIDAIYMDFHKAFVSVPHQKLMKKVGAYEIQGKIHRWIKVFLGGRTQQVTVNGVKSDEAPVTSGIPQGSVLGLILFALYNNDLPCHIKSQASIFADDTKLFNQSDSQEARTILQDDLNRLHQRSLVWQLFFHSKMLCDETGTPWRTSSL